MSFKEGKIKMSFKEGKIKMSFKVGISNYYLLAPYGEKRSLEIIKEIGADSVDYFLNSQNTTNQNSIYSRSDAEITAYYSDMRKYIDSLGIAVFQTHGRLRTYMNDPAKDSLCLENARRDLLASAALGVDICVMHGVTTSEMGADADPQTMRDLNYEVFSKILPWAKEYGVRIATETFGFCSKLDVPEFFSKSAEFKATYDRIANEGNNADYFKVCVDTGHINTTSRYDGVSVGDFIRMMGDAVVCLHMHDNDGYSDQHRLPYIGTIDWEDTLNALDEIGYKGVYNLEIKSNLFGNDLSVETAEFAVKLMKRMLRRRNA